jgi:hypothetical protein
MVDLFALDWRFSSTHVCSAEEELGERVHAPTPWIVNFIFFCSEYGDWARASKERKKLFCL